MTRAGRGVDLLGGHAHRGGRDPGRLGLVQHRVQLGQLGGNRPGVDAAGDVGAVAHPVLVGQGAPEVAQHHLAGLDHPVAGVVVRAGRVLAGGDDGEVDPVRGPRPPGAGRGRRTPRPRCAPPAAMSPDCSWCATRSAAAAARRSAATSAASLTARSGPDHRRRHARSGRRGSCRWSSTTKRAQVRSPMATVAADPTSPATSADRVLGLAPRLQGEHPGLLPDAGRLEPGHHQRGVAVGGHDQHGEPLQRHGLVAAQPRQLGADRQQQHLDALLDHGGPDPLEAGREDGAHAVPSTGSAGRPSMLARFFSAWYSASPSAPLRSAHSLSSGRSSPRSRNGTA